VWKKAQERPRFALKKALQLLSENFPQCFVSKDQIRRGVFDLDQ
jgi:hypothetical protein